MILSRSISSTKAGAMNKIPRIAYHDSAQESLLLLRSSTSTLTTIYPFRTTSLSALYSFTEAYGNHTDAPVESIIGYSMTWFAKLQYCSKIDDGGLGLTPSSVSAPVASIGVAASASQFFHVVFTNVSGGMPSNFKDRVSSGLSSSGVTPYLRDISLAC